MGDIDEFEKGMRLLLDRLSFNQDVNVSVFETNIRVLGNYSIVILTITML